MSNSDPDDLPEVSQSPEIEVSTEELADQERQDAHSEDRDRGAAGEQERFEEGRFHSRSQWDRGTGDW
jgi:hypothetical protein